MNIVHVVPYYPPHLGGMERVVEELALAQAKQGHKVTVITSNIEQRKDTKRSALTVKTLPAFTVAHTPIIPSLFSHLMRIPKDAIIHVHIAQALTPEVVWLASWLRQTPYIAHVHLDVDPSGKAGMFLPAYKKLFLKHVLKKAAKIVVPTSSYKTLIARKYKIPERSIAVVPNGVHTRNTLRKNYALQKPPIVLFVGRLSSQKNIPLLLRSIKKAGQTTPIRLRIVGEGEERAETEILIRQLHLEEFVTLVGKKEGKALEHEYMNSDMLVFPSRSESFGMVILESFCYGLPVIASDIIGVRDVIKKGQTGLLVQTTPVAVAGAICRLLRNKQLRERLGRNGFASAKNYDWSIIEEKMTRIYAEVLRGHQ